MSRRKVTVSMNGGDEVSLLLALACLAHCLLTPLLAFAWPLVGVPLVRSAGLHQWLAGITLVLSPLMLVPGYRQHRRWVIAAVGACGALLLLLGATQAGANCCSAILSWIQGDRTVIDIGWRDWIGFLTTPIGCLLLGVAHWRNSRWQKSCDSSCHRSRAQ